MPNSHLTYRKLSSSFPATGLKHLFDVSLPGKTLAQCRQIIKKSTIIGAFEGKTLVGIARSLDDDVYAFLTDVLVNPDYRGRGIGSVLVEKLCVALKAKNIKVVSCETDVPLISFYRKAAGFKYSKGDITMYLFN
jgi:ribosomal protein S18 acetylase RimI-like enzyme